MKVPYQGPCLSSNQKGENYDKSKGRVTAEWYFIEVKRV